MPCAGHRLTSWAELGWFWLLLCGAGRSAALTYARGHFAQFSGTCLPDIQRLMGCLLFEGRLSASPYADLLSDSMWQSAAEEFTRQCCGLLGQASPQLHGCALAW